MTTLVYDLHVSSEGIVRIQFLNGFDERQIATIRSEIMKYFRRDDVGIMWRGQGVTFFGQITVKGGVSADEVRTVVAECVARWE